MRRFGVLIIILGAAFAFFCSFVVVGSSYGVYIKKSPSLEHVYFNAGNSILDMAQLLLTLEERYSMLLVAYSEESGIRFLEDMPALP